LNEILSLNIQDIDLESKKIIIKTEKHTENNPFRNIFYREQTIVYLKIWITKREHLLKTLTIEDKDALFISVVGGACGEGVNARRCDIAAIGEVMRKYSKRAGLASTFNAHSLRHRFGRVLAEKKVNDLMIAQFMGHRSTDSSRIYTELFGPVLHKIYSKVMGK
jgi:integrase